MRGSALGYARDVTHTFTYGSDPVASVAAIEAEVDRIAVDGYHVALQSVESVPVEGASAELLQAIEAARERLANETLRARRSLE